MTSLQVITMATWFAGTAVLYVWWGNEMRQALNNLTPGTRFSDYTQTGFLGFRFVARAIKPEKLTEQGRVHRKKAIRIESFIAVWTICGFFLLGGVSYYADPW